MFFETNNGSDTMSDKSFLQHHREGPMIRMPNAWDVGSAKVMAAAGAHALGTTSAGIVYTMGLPDYIGALSRDDCLRAVEAIAGAVDIPVSVDSEDGYGDTADAVAETFRMMIEAGAQGGSIEDHRRADDDTLMSAEETVDRIAAARAAIDASDRPFVLTARAECFLVGHPSPLDESIRRLKLYESAGADCLYAPGLATRADIAAVLDAVRTPINVLIGYRGLKVSLDDLETMGVRRVSTGGSVACATFALMRDAVTELNAGRVGYLDNMITHAELTELFS